MVCPLRRWRQLSGATQLRILTDHGPEPMREEFVHLVAIAAIAALLLIPAASPASAAGLASAQHRVTDMSGAKKQKKARKQRGRVEYMRAVPSGAPTGR
jgi:hypothetical protein